MNDLSFAMRSLWRLFWGFIFFALVMPGAPAQAQPVSTSSLPFLTSAHPQDGTANVALRPTIELSLSGRLLPSQRSGLSITLLGPNGATPASVEPSGERTLRIRPQLDLLPGSAYTLMVQASTGSPPWIALGFRTRELDAEIAASRTDTDDEPGHGFTPTPQHRKGQWRTGVVHPHSRDAQVRAIEQATLLDRLPVAPRQRLMARMQEAGEAITLDPRSKLVQRRAERASRASGEGPLQTQPASLTGQVLSLDGRPLSGVVLNIGDRSTETDDEGEFELSQLAAGTQVLVINGHRAGRRERDYGRYEYRVELTPGANDLPHTIWLTRIDRRHAVRLASPTREDTVVTHPAIPGLELRLPAGAVVLDAHGQVVREVSITPIPADQMPFPMPYSDVPLYYTIQPGGARIVSVDGRPVGATLRYPNYSTQPPGAKIDLFDYDPWGRGWYTYATGTVSTDGQRVDSVEPFTIYQFAMSSVASPGGPPGGTPSPCSSQCCPAPRPAPGPGPSPNPASDPGGDEAGDPITCSSGLFSERSTDLHLPDTLPIRLEREYRQNDTNQRAFGIGSNGFYNQYLYFEGQAGFNVQAIQLVQPSGAPVRFVPTGASNDVRYAVFESTDPGPYMKARLAISAPTYGSDFIITTKHGQRYGFSYYQSKLKWTEDRYGNRTTVLRDTSQRVSRVVSPHGRFIEFQYTSANCSTCITRATDHSGRSIQYNYDTLGRLERVTWPDTTHTDYTYDSAHRMLTVTDPRGHRKVLNEYWLNTGNTALEGRVRRQTYADDTTHDFAYEFDAQGRITASEVTDQRGVVRRREYDSSQFIVRDVFAKSTPQQAVFVFERDPVTHLITQTTDPLNRVTRFGYDTLGNQTSRTVLYGTPQATTWTTTYEPQYSQPLISTDPLNRHTTRVYDAQNRLSETRNELGHRTTYTWYPEGQMAQRCAASQRRTTRSRLSYSVVLN